MNNRIKNNFKNLTRPVNKSNYNKSDTKLPKLTNLIKTNILTKLYNNFKSINNMNKNINSFNYIITNINDILDSLRFFKNIKLLNIIRNMLLVVKTILSSISIVINILTSIRQNLDNDTTIISDADIIKDYIDDNIVNTSEMYYDNLSIELTKDMFNFLLQTNEKEKIYLNMVKGKIEITINKIDAERVLIKFNDYYITINNYKVLYVQFYSNTMFNNKSDDILSLDLYIYYDKSMKRCITDEYISDMIKKAYVKNIDYNNIILGILDNEINMKQINKDQYCTNIPKIYKEQFDYEKLIEDINYNFNNNKTDSIGLVGRIGVGKSSIIKQVIKEINNIPIIFVHLSEEHNSKDINKLFELIRLFDKKILVFEDVDSSYLEYKNDILIMNLDNLKNTFSIFTINNTSKIHSSIIERPGRINRLVEIKIPSTLSSIRHITEQYEQSFNDKDILTLQKLELTQAELRLICERMKRLSNLDEVITEFTNSKQTIKKFK